MRRTTTLLLAAFAVVAASCGQPDAEVTMAGLDAAEFATDRVFIDPDGTTRTAFDDPENPGNNGETEGSAEEADNSPNSSAVPADEDNPKADAGKVAGPPRAGINTISGQIPDSSPLGGFEIICDVVGEKALDPILGGSEQNLFIGNTSVTGSGIDLGGSATTTCPGGQADLSSYWMPAVKNGSGTTMIPDRVRVTYIRLGVDGKKIKAPQEGYEVLTGNPNATIEQPTTVAIWNCWNEQSQTYRPPYDNTSSSLMPVCNEGEQLNVQLKFAQCWNGSDLASSTRSHITRAIGTTVTTDSDGRKINTTCPSSHPVATPRLVLEMSWMPPTVGAGTDSWFLSSDDTNGDGKPDLPSGTTTYGGWINGWDQATAETWVENCLQTSRHCFGGQLGDGKKLV